MLPHHPGKCSRLHGHSYRLEVSVSGPLHERGPASGMVIDFDEISRVVHDSIIAPLDHASLNDFLPNPTAENIVLWMWQRLAPTLPGLDELVLWETATACAVLRATEAPRT